MPEYTFENSCGQTQDIFYTMSEVPSVGSEIDIDGVKWKRVFTKPNAAISTQGDPYSASDFNKSLDGKNVTIGDMWSKSAEMSEKRAAKDGVDPVKRKYFDDYSKARKGHKHQAEKAEIHKETSKQVIQEMKKVVDNIRSI